jgi:hypothetical protein
MIRTCWVETLVSRGEDVAETLPLSPLWHFGRWEDEPDDEQLKAKITWFSEPKITKMPFDFRRLEKVREKRWRQGERAPNHRPQIEGQTPLAPDHPLDLGGNLLRPAMPRRERGSHVAGGVQREEKAAAKPPMSRNPPRPCRLGVSQPGASRRARRRRSSRLLE